MTTSASDDLGMAFLPNSSHGQKQGFVEFAQIITGFGKHVRENFRDSWKGSSLEMATIGLLCLVMLL